MKTTSEKVASWPASNEFEAFAIWQTKQAQDRKISAALRKMVWRTYRTTNINHAESK